MADKANGVSDDTVKLALSDCPRYVREYVAALEAKLEAAERDAAALRERCERLEAECIRERRLSLAAERDQRRWHCVEAKAQQKTAYDVYGPGAHWYVGIFSVDSRWTFAQTVDAAIDAQRQEGKHG